MDVPDGYAMNFLFPQHLAVKVADSVMTDTQEARHLKSLKPVAISAEQELAGEIDGLEVVIPIQLKKGKVTTPITATEVRAALKDMGYKLPKSAIQMEPVNSLGSVDVPIKLGQGFEAVITLVVESAP